ncbi:hypothetical protein [Vibrio vulnificus]|uniref:Uncharacterized protein n=1 Tax=Vibrio vulnificus TaxID=672 RepID=A0ABX4WY02_VIBVL|nr:hypothetical protein [Vibrio vulnificus]KHF81867.1 hypothetical protein OA15_21225 [Vibrio vulnificus]KHF93474.1 hypothetical protein OA14_20595 [Vibrio vulnificus]MCU8536311.1 hypothetical protein [Vibrio vulnificus]OJI21708.1 hypothetical protein VVORL1506_02051 [Vibrio vulnificus]OJI23454.1 hypothetical protein VVNSV5830_02814 [Vibrio vulnificus]
MAQGNNKKALNKKVRKGDKGFPVATVAFYGPDNTVATKLVCAIIPYDGADPEPMKKWFKETDIRKDELILKEVLAFIENNGAKTVSMVEDVIGCPHEEGIDYPEGEHCPQCLYWKGKDRFAGTMLH